MPGVNRSAERHSVAGLHPLDAPGIAVPESLIAPEAPRTRTVIDRCRRIEVARPIAVVGAVGLSLARKQRAAGRAGGSTGARITHPQKHQAFAGLAPVIAAPATLAAAVTARRLIRVSFGCGLYSSSPSVDACSQSTLLQVAQTRSDQRLLGGDQRRLFEFDFAAWGAFAQASGVTAKDSHRTQKKRPGRAPAMENGRKI
jgi:hypothetical protein